MAVGISTGVVADTGEDVFKYCQPVEGARGNHVARGLQGDGEAHRAETSMALVFG
jgi:hypothetical protein